MLAGLKRILLFAGNVVIPFDFLVQGTTLFVLAERGELVGGAAAGWGRWFIVGPVLAPVLMLGLWAAAAYDIWHVARNGRLTNGGRGGWVCAILLGNVVVLPIYWAIYLRRGAGEVRGTGTEGT